jgi:hypothetical protein
VSHRLHLPGGRHCRVDVVWTPNSSSRTITLLAHTKASGSINHPDRSPRWSPSRVRTLRDAATASNW